jgi:hypothetical protein
MMAEYATRFNKAAGAYYVAEISGDDGEDIAATKLFSTLRDAERYQQSCEGGQLKFEAGYEPPPVANPMGGGMAVGEVNPKVVAKLKEHATQPPRVPVPSNGGVARTSAGLRNALFDEIDALRRGAGDARRAMAIAKLAQNILATAKLEYQIEREGAPLRPSPILLDSSDG